MSIITRPTKAVGGSGTTAWVDGNKLPAAELNADIATLYADYNGNITDANILNVSGAKLLDTTIPAGKHAAGSIATADIANLQVTEDKLAALAVTSGKLGALAVLYGKLKVNTTQINWGAGAAGILTGAYATYDLSSLTPATNVTLTTPISSSAVGTPFLIERCKQVGGIDTGNTLLLTLSILKNQTDSKYHLIAYNPSPGSIVLAAYLLVNIYWFGVA